MAIGDKAPQLDLYIVSNAGNEKGGPHLLRAFPKYDDILDEKSGIWGEDAKRIMGKADMIGRSRTEIWSGGGESSGGRETVGRTFYDFNVVKPPGESNVPKKDKVTIDATDLERLSGREKYAEVAKRLCDNIQFIEDMTILIS